jgi:UDP-N-acetylglucosamine 4,6-dehydratase
MDFRKFDDCSVLITGGTGSFGRQCVRTLLENCSPRRLIVYSRDELKQYEMAQEFPERRFDCLRFFLGDVRDRERLEQAFSGVDYVIHAAALKQVPAAEYNPFEAIKTNILGAQHIIEAAIRQRVGKVVALSTDKACNPANLYGATKLCSDKLFIAGNSYVGAGPTRFGVVRYGNVIGSRGSIVPMLLERRKVGRVPLTHPEMTRFAITLPQAVEFALRSLTDMEGGEVFIPKIPSVRVLDLIEAIAPGCEIDVIGIRPGEKLHECLLSRDDSRYTLDAGASYVIQPAFRFWKGARWAEAAPVSEDFEYTSDGNGWWMSRTEIEAVVAGYAASRASSVEPHGAEAPVQAALAAASPRLGRSQ